MPVFSQNKFIRYLVKNHLVPLYRINLAYHEQKRTGGTLAANLLRRGYISEDDLNQALADTMAISYLELIPSRIDPAVVSLVPPEILTEHLALPISREGRVVQVAFADPSDHRALQDLALFSKQEIKPIVARRESISLALNYFLGGEESPAGEKGRGTEYLPPSDLPYDSIIRDTTGTTLVFFHLVEARHTQAYQIHFESSSRGLQVRYRTSSGMSPRVWYPPSFREICLSRLRIIAEAEPGQADSVSIPLVLEGDKIQVKLDFFSSGSGQNAVVTITGRTISRGKKRIPRPDDKKVKKFVRLLLNLPGLYVFCVRRGYDRPDFPAEIFRKAVSSRRKAIAIKSEINPRGADFEEIIVPSGHDREYRRALEAAARQQPDLIYLDYLEGPATLKTVFQLVLSGSTILARSDFIHPADLLSYFLESGRKNSMITAVLRAILIVRPVRLLCPNCREERPGTPEEIKSYPFLSDFSSLGRKKGCPGCEGTGYSGRKWLTELVVLTAELKKCIFTSPNSWELRRQWEKEAGEDILRQARELLHKGKINLEEYEVIST